MLKDGLAACLRLQRVLDIASDGDNHKRTARLIREMPVSYLEFLRKVVNLYPYE